MGTSDVIDTESADGDIVKILLGSFVEEYDNLEHVISPSLDATPERSVSIASLKPRLC